MNTNFKDGPEAKRWLDENGHEAALASNRFDSTDAAKRFVASLYEYGAKRVFIDSETIISDEEEMKLGGDYADAIVIELEDGSASEELRSAYMKEAAHEGYDLEGESLPVIEGKYLYLWWD